LTSFTVGGNWPDTSGKHINAHGGNIIYRAPLKTYYWYGEYRSRPAGASCYSSRDLYNWTFEGVVMEKGQIPIFERPKVVYNEKTKKYVMWFHYDGGNFYSIAELGVAVSDSPKGPFQLLKHMRPNGHQSRDIGMYIDEETQKVYIGYAADRNGKMNSTVRMVELTPDYLDVTANDVDIDAHCEGPGILKHNGVYYLLTSQCSGWTPNPATYYTATNIMGPYKKVGNPCVDAGSETTYNSQPCYIFKVPGYADGYVYMGDRWNGGGSSKSQYVFLPITITADGKMVLRNLTSWSLKKFTPASINPK
jgi:beta-galactosidase